MIQRYTRCLWACFALLFISLSHQSSGQSCPLVTAGTYTINSAQPTGGTNFNSFSAAVTALSCGISGPVMINVVPGTYQGSVTIPVIPGASAVNTITINGHSDTLQAGTSSATATRAAITFDGADWIRIDSLVIDVSDSTYGFGLRFANNADHNTINNCTIKATTTSTSSSNAGIVFSASATSATNSGNNGNYNTFYGNVVIGGYYGVTVYASSTTVNRGNKFEYNKFQDAYYYSFYSYYSDSTRLYHNEMSRPTRTSVSGPYGYYLSTGTTNAWVEANTITNMYGGAPASTAALYPYACVSSASATSPNTFINNIAYNLGGGNNTIYGLYFSGASNVKAYHNTIVIDNASSTSAGAYGFYNTSSVSNVDLRDNIFYITRAGTGTKYGIYSSGTITNFTSDYNDVYVNSPAGTNNFGYYSGSAQATLAAWQSTTGQDAHSSDIDPQFTAAATGNLLPQNSLLIGSGIGVGVTNDIIGTPRDLNVPEPGAFEIPPVVGNDVAGVGLELPVQQTCYGSPQTIKVTVRNLGSSPLNLATSPITVTANVTGPNPVSFAPVVVNTGTVAAGDTIQITITNNYSMSAPGSYVFNASATVSGDVIAGNNAISPVTIVSTAVQAGTINSAPASFCVTGGIPSLTLSGYNGVGSFQWQQAPDPAGPWTNVGTGTDTYMPVTALTDTMFYRAIVSCGTQHDTASVSVNVNNPSLLTTAPASRCGTGTVTLGATPAANNGLRWYDAATGGNLVDTTNSYTTPVLTSTTTYYVAAATPGYANVGLSSPNVYPNQWGTNSSFTAGLQFNVTAPSIVIKSVDIYPTAPIGTAFQIAIRAGSSTASPLLIYQDTVKVSGSTTNPVKQTVNVNFTVPQGNSYYMTFYNGALTAPLSGTAVYPSALRTYVSAGISSYPFTVPGVVSITSSTAGNIYVYYFYDWVVSSTCESPRQAVTATVTPGPTFSLTPSGTICNNAITPLTVTSPAANFNTYTWSPVANLYTDAAATIPYTGGSASTVYLKTSTAGPVKYYATALNTTSNCGGYDSVTLNVLPGNVSINATPQTICTSGSTSLNLSPLGGYAGGAISWFSSLNGTSYTLISGVNGSVYTTPVLTDTAYYRVQIKNSAGAVCQTIIDTINVVSPMLLSTTPASRCNPGPVTLAATVQGGTAVWYDAAIGGNQVATGNSFTTPSLNATTTYYVQASAGGSGSQQVGPANTNIGGTLATNSSYTSGMLFDVIGSPATIQTVDIYPTSAVGTNFQIVIRSGSATGTVLQTYQGTTTVSGSTANPVAQTVPVNFTLPAGSYAMTFYNGTLSAPLSGTATYPNALRNYQSSGSLPYPYTIPGVLSITSSSLGNNYLYYFYNWQVGTGCSSTRTAVTASIFPTTQVTTQPQSFSGCAGSNVKLTVGVAGGGLQYQWRKNGVAIAGATSDTLAFTPAHPSDNGSYDVIVTGSCGADTSAVATINISSSNTWTGTVSTDWNNAANWCGGVPDSATNVVIVAGTPYQPTLTGSGSAKDITLNSGSMLSLSSSGILNIYGNYLSNGVFAGSVGTIAFRGTGAHTVDTITAGNVTMNGTGTATLTGNLTVVFGLNLVNGHIMLGNNDLIISGPANGSAASHIITNGAGSVVSNNINTLPVVVPVGPDAASYNPVTISNGGGHNYTVRVSTGISPAITNPARAINRTWYVKPGGQPNSPVGITLQYADAQGNTSAAPAGIQDVGVYNGTQWVRASGAGVTPAGTATARTVTFSTSVYGPMVLTTPGGIDFPTAVSALDPAITGVRLLPTLVGDRATLEVTSTRSGSSQWTVTDAAGKTVIFKKASLARGLNRIEINASGLAGGMYQVRGTTPNGVTEVIRFIKE